MLPGLLFTAVLTAAGCAASKSFLPSDFPASRAAGQSPDLQVLEEVLDALRVLQSEYFQPWMGHWPKAIDWTAAVMGSHVSGTLTSLSQSLDLVRLDESEDYRVKENIINHYFSQVVSSYFGQNDLSIRHQAFDDMLWVVLGWLDTTQFVELHTELRYQKGPQATGLGEDIPSILRNQTWHGNLWVPSFAHRARVFWELASKGWDYTLCGGGMTWNPRLEPYKNAITNELFIAASISMFLYFPGDVNTCPFGSRSDCSGGDADLSDVADWKPHDPRYLYAAVEGYAWLMNSNMTNEQGLFVDGFHISGFRNKSDPNTKCDARNEMVYTYNQGVILTGQLGLFKVTRNTSYLKDGHSLIQNVIAATGYDLARDRPADDLPALQPGSPLPRWHGLGRAGVLEDKCDVRGDCSQNSHTFKGIFFHHLAAFCAPLEPAPDLPPPHTVYEQQQDDDGLEKAREAHARACRAYTGWLRHNAMAALRTRDSRGVFGMWWTAGLLNLTSDYYVADGDAEPQQHGGAVDYRNRRVPDDPRWDTALGSPPPHEPAEPGQQQQPLSGPVERASSGRTAPVAGSGTSDPNDRGRGRTVETQGSGLAVLRALWEVSRLGSVS
ncbi:glycoside hydrolase, family 76 [Phialemonium atrogriseum]|uniref:Glycoside hydrolase, family 76 n=1 Tax=Phialemonium atrogriseum TaxID=1093897 RepID=A0AAJ0C3V2_9PEZI|nr:glycoside hydrolase, family 76 [Phialemonium atrogriseum]KAK1767151.1 glycoside hydrolase, family 76 [Phialemonium atrogriseum]